METVSETIAITQVRDHTGLDQVVVIKVVRNKCILDIFKKERKQDLLKIWVWAMKERNQRSSIKWIQSLIRFKEYLLGSVLCTIICWPLGKALGVHWLTKHTVLAFMELTFL